MCEGIDVAGAVGRECGIGVILQRNAPRRETDCSKLLDNPCGLVFASLSWI